MSEYVLELKGITKIFPGVKALNNVQFQLKPGEVHALMGENGAGKSTFIKVITGVHKAEEGEMYLFGEKVDFKGPKDAQEAGIAAVYQHPTSYPHLTVAENMIQANAGIKAIFAHNDEMALGAISAAKSANKNIMIVGFDGTEDGMKAVEDGDLVATIAQQPDKMGEMGVDAAVKLVKGESVEKNIAIDLKLVQKQ